MDPNCEKMFDNGNFRRKRKRRSDPSSTGGSAVTGPTKTEEGRSGAQPKPAESPQLLGPSSPDMDTLNDNHKSLSTSSSLSPPGLSSSTSTPCYNNFYSSMSTLTSGAPGRQGSLGLVNELSNRNITALSPYHHHHHHPNHSHAGQEASEHGDGLHFNRGVYYNTFSGGGGQSGQFNGHFYNSFALNSLIYPRDGTEL